MAIFITLIISIPILLAKGMERISYLNSLRLNSESLACLMTILTSWVKYCLVTTLVRMTTTIVDAIKMFSQVQEEWEVDSRGF